MKRILLAAALPLAAMTMQAAVPEGAMHILGLNGDNTPSAINEIPLGERDEEDIDEGLWRWSLPSFEITQETGAFTVTVGDELKLGFYTDNPYGMTNNLTSSANMIYMWPGGPAVNYNLPAGDYNIMVSAFEDLDGDMGGDSWMIRIQSNNPVEDEANYYLIGFDENNEPNAGCRFKRELMEEDGESFYMYSLPKYYLGECPEGFTVYDSTADAYLGLDTTFGGGEVTDENPFAFLAAGQPAAACSLTPGYYTVNFSAMGAMSMISFIFCEDQTAVNEMTYYLIGANGIMEASDAIKFERTVESFEYEEDGEIISVESVSYRLDGFEFKDAPDGVLVANADGDVVFGYNTDLAMFMPNEISDDSPFTMMSVYGEPVNVTVTPGKYDISFNLAGTTGAALMFMPTEEGAVEGVDAVDAVPVYYNLQGVRVMNPSEGIHIVRRGSKVTKEVIR